MGLNGMASWERGVRKPSQYSFLVCLVRETVEFPRRPTHPPRWWRAFHRRTHSPNQQHRLRSRREHSAKWCAWRRIYHGRVILREGVGFAFHPVVSFAGAEAAAEGGGFLLASGVCASSKEDRRTVGSTRCTMPEGGLLCLPGFA